MQNKIKAIKISLAVIVIIAIAFFVIRSFVKIEEVGEIQKSDNPFINKIQQEIIAIRQKPENTFCKDVYEIADYHINDNHQHNRFGKNTIENDQWKDILSKELYATYSDKFVKQSYYFFNQSAWPTSDLDFIRNECRKLQNSSLIERSSPIYKKLSEINAIVHRYDQIMGFIISCNNFSFSQTKLEVSFPIDDIQSKISVANGFKDSNLGNSYLNNCIRLHNELGKIPQVLFRAHVRYLDNLITYWSNNFTGYQTQRTYANELYNPILDRINQLDYDIYKVSEFSDEYTRLKNKWAKDAANAYAHFNSK